MGILKLVTKNNSNQIPYKNEYTHYSVYYEKVKYGRLVVKLHA